MKERQDQSNGKSGRTRAASSGRYASSNGGWKGRVQRPRITDPKERQAAVERATSRIKTDVTVDLTRERRGK